MNEMSRSGLSEQERYKVPAVARAVAMLDLVAREPGLNFTAVRSRLGLPKSSAHHLISTLCGLGLLKVGSDGGHALGLRLIELAGLASVNRSLEREARPFLRALARDLQLISHLGVLDGHEAVYLARIECDLEIMVKSWVGKRFPLNSSALGKVLLAWLPPEELDEMLALIPFEGRMPNTITDPDNFRAHLALVRERGWATDDEEQAPDLRCIAAPVRDQTGRVVAAISAVGTVMQIDAASFPHLGPRLCGTARDVSRALFRT